jgi:hypothetical protein
MRKLLVAACCAASVSVCLPAAAVAAPDPPPTDPVHIEGGGGCAPDYPCTPRPISVDVDETYPKRLAVWAVGLVP